MKDRLVWICGLALCTALAPSLAATGAQVGERTQEETDASESQSPETASDQRAMMEAFARASTPGPQHERLAASAGSWKATVKTWMEPGEPRVSHGTFEREMILGGRVLEEHFEGSFMEMPFNGHGQTGYDNVRGEYWTTWIDSMSTGPMIAWGEWDEEIGGVVYRAESSDPMTGEVAASKIVVTHPEKGREVMTMYETHDGQQVKTMEITSVRQTSEASDESAQATGTE